MNCFNYLIAILLSVQTNAFIAKGPIKVHNAAPVRNLCSNRIANFNDGCNVGTITLLRSSIQEDGEYLRPSHTSKTVISSRRRFLHNGSTRMLTILTIAIGVTKRLTDQHALGVEEIFHLEKNVTRSF